MAGADLLDGRGVLVLIGGIRAELVDMGAAIGANLTHGGHVVRISALVDTGLVAGAEHLDHGGVVERPGGCSQTGKERDGGDK